MSQPIKGNEKSYLYFVIPLLVYTLKAIILMRGGALYGHLAIPPPYDDVSYFTDAMERVRVFFNSGLYGYLNGLITNPPHAPYSTVAASIAFLFGGPNVAGPYIMNAITAALLSTLLFRSFRLATSTMCCISIVLITTGWFDNLVTIYHPDLISGFGAATMAAVLLWQDEIITRRMHALLIGSAGGVIALIKPNALVMLVVLWALAFLVGAVLSYRKDKSLRTIGMRLFFGVLPILVIAGPYFAQELGNIFNYIFTELVHHRQTWMSVVPSEQRSMFYWNTARANFECWFFVAGGGALGTVAFASYLGDGTTALRFVGLILLTLVAYFVPASVEVKHFLFGGVFYGCIAVCLVLVFHFFTDRLLVQFWSSRWKQRSEISNCGIQHVRLLALTLVGLFAMTGFADKQGRFPPQLISALWTQYDGVYRLLRDVFAGQQEIPANPSPTLPVYFPCPAPVAPVAYRFRGLLEGLDIEVTQSVHASDVHDLIDVANRAAIIVVPDDESLKSVYPYPVNKLIPAFRTWLNQSTNFKPLGNVRTSLGGTSVFANVSVAGGTKPGSQSH